MKFSKTDFDYHRGYLTYGADRKFVAVFKHRGSVDKADFVRLLTKYYTVEDYFAKLKHSAPFKILMDDGFVTVDTVNHRILVAK